jgi:hypothetical protein
MDSMSAEKFTNARVHEWLTPSIDAVADAMRTTRLQLNSAALWWFCRNLSAEERADILGEYVKVQALTGGTAPADKPAPAATGGKRPGGSRRRKVAGGG